MWIIGCDFHSGFQQIAIFDNQSGEMEEKKLLHPAEAREFYRGLQGEVLVGMESGCPSQWFRRLMTHPGVGPQTALGMVLTVGQVNRFASSKQVASYLGLTPREHGSGGKQRLGHISKQGSSFMRFLLVEAGQTAVRGDEELQRAYRRLAARKSRAVAKVMVARRLAVENHGRSR